MDVRHALLSVYHKTGIVEFASGLRELGFKLLSSGGTAKALAEAGLPVTDISTLVGAPILGHRVVTLSRELHAGILARDTLEDMRELETLGIPKIDLVCVDFYPLDDEIAKPGATRESVIEKTDIGGPTLVRAAAKARRIVLCAPAQRAMVLEWLQAGEPEPEAFLDVLAAEVEAMVAGYCLASARFHSGGAWDGIIGRRFAECSYGENAWQMPSALYRTDEDDPLALPNFQSVGGKPPSYNNWCDVDRALQTMTHIAAAFEKNLGLIPNIAIGVKHGNACGAAVSGVYGLALRGMLEGDPRAIYGGVVMTNFEIDSAAADVLLHYQVENGRRVLDGVIAPSITDEAQLLLDRKKGKARLLENPALAHLRGSNLDRATLYRQVRGGFLGQPNYTYVLDLKDGSAFVHGNPSFKIADLSLAWAIAATSNSNTVTLVRDQKLIGNGVGQQDRVSCSELAIKRARDAGHDVHGAVAASDSFFPFPDGPQVLADAGVSMILATSGSIRDGEVIQLCQDRGVTLVLVPDAVGRGFYKH